MKQDETDSFIKKRKEGLGKVAGKLLKLGWTGKSTENDTDMKECKKTILHVQKIHSMQGRLLALILSSPPCFCLHQELQYNQENDIATGKNRAKMSFKYQEFLKCVGYFHQIMNY